MIRGALVAAALALAASATAAPRAPRLAGRADRVEHVDPDAPPSRGPARALVTVEIFLPLGSVSPPPALRLLAQLQDRHPNRLRLVYRVLRGTSGPMVPSAALEAHAQGRFFEFLDELSRFRGSIKKDDLRDAARRAGVDDRRIDLADKLDRYREVLEANQRRLERIHAGGAPSMLFNGVQPKLSMTAVTPGDLDREYALAEGRAFDKLDRGYALEDLPAAFDDDAVHDTQPFVASPGRPDEPGDRAPTDHPLASPPLALAGLPSFGKPDAAIPVVILCRPDDARCGNLLKVVESEARLYPDEVRVVWAPWFNARNDDAARLTLLADAALCAEEIGSYHTELTTSAGWSWVKTMYAETGRGRKQDADKLIDGVAAKLDLDSRALAACRARMASSALDWIAGASKAGVRGDLSVVVIGGRVYDGLVDPALIHELVEAELAPGVLGALPRWK